MCKFVRWTYIHRWKVPLFCVPAVTPDMKLTPSAGSDRAWVWTVQADFADEEAKVEQLAIRFKNRESEHILLINFI